ncbi:MAG: hypothetical protein ABIW49_04915 [Knoellia sp.]
MKIMILDSGRGHNAALVEDLRTELGLEDNDEIIWLARELPKELLPVTTHLLAQNSLGLFGRTLHVQTLIGGPGAKYDIGAAAIRRTNAKIEANHGQGDAEDDEDVLGMPSEQFEEMLPESVQDHEHFKDEHAGGATPEEDDNAALPVRVAHAVKWRTNTVRVAGKDFYRRGKASARRRINKSEVPPVVVARKALKTALPNIGTKFGLATAQSRDAIEHAASCDVVFSHDARSHKAAWLLAQRTPNPDVVVGVNAARRAIEERRARG